jgi:pyruvate kinase
MNKQAKKTKIIATIGPASGNYSVLNQLIRAGADILRFNLKYNTPAGHGRIIDMARKAAHKQGRSLNILIDLPGLSFSEGVGLAAGKKAEYVALSYVKRANEVIKLKKALNKIKLPASIVAKIETRDALNNFSAIEREADVIMVARGDLGKSIPIEKIPFVQKEIVWLGKKTGKKIIIATEMLLSMVLNKKPTRAEVSDVANAVLEGNDAVMLSEETAIGKNPAEAVRMMHKIINEAESWRKFGHLDIFSAKNRILKFGAKFHKKTSARARGSKASGS